MTPLTTKDIPLSQAQKQWYEATCKKIDLGRLKQLIFDLTAKHSPTGAERGACEFMADYLNGVGMPWIVPERNHAGISNGVNHLLSHGVTADSGVICKPYPGAPLMAGQTDAATIN